MFFLLFRIDYIYIPDGCSQKFHNPQQQLTIQSNVCRNEHFFWLIYIFVVVWISWHLTTHSTTTHTLFLSRRTRQWQHFMLCTLNTHYSPLLGIHSIHFGISFCRMELLPLYSIHSIYEQNKNCLFFSSVKNSRPPQSQLSHSPFQCAVKCQIHWCARSPNCWFG